MRRARSALQSRIVLVLALFLTTPAAAKDIDEARAAYVAAVVAAMEADGPLNALSKALISAEDELSIVRAAEEQALSSALTEPQAALLQAEATVRDLSAKEVTVLPRTAQATADAARLENELRSIARVAEDRAATLEDIKTQLTAALVSQQDLQSALAIEQTNLASVVATQQDIVQLQALARTAAGLQDPKLREYVWSTYSPRVLVRAVRNAFITSALGEIVHDADGAQSRVGNYSNRSSVWKFEDVPQGDTWLLWDSRTNGPLDLIRPRNDVFEQPVFLQIPVTRNTLVDALGLQRVEIADVGKSLWPTVGATTYDACLNRLVQGSEDGVIRQICQTLFPADARFEVQVINAPDISGRAILLSGGQARAYAELYRQHIADLRDLANGELPTLLLPAIQQGIQGQADEVARQVEDATKRVRVAETTAKKSSDTVERLQQAQDAGVAANASAAILDDKNIIAINARLTELQEELAKLKAEADREAATLAARRTVAADAVEAAQAVIDAESARVFKDWAARREQAQQAVGVASEALARGQKESANTQSLTKLEREHFLAALARDKVLRSVSFQRNQICLRLQNTSKHFVRLKIGKLHFREEAFPRIDLLDGISDGDFIFRGIKSGDEISFRNKYQEAVAGLPPTQAVQECSFISDPKAGELGRLFDSIGGFSQSGWDVELDVRFGTFNDTDKAINFVSNEVIFADELTAARDEASAAFLKVTAISDPSGSSSREPDEAPPELAPVSEVQADRETIAPDLAASGGSDERGNAPGIDDAADELLAIDRVIGRELQAALNSAGFSVGQPDGVIGPRSVKAITDWQAKQGFVASGALTRGQAAVLLGRDLP